MAKKYSMFPSAPSVSAADSVVGLHDGENSRFSFATILSFIQSLFVPTSRKVNNKALSSDITLNASDVGAVNTSAVGVADGVASLDSNGQVPSTQLPPIASTAADVTYNNTTSGLNADDVQEALDELAAGAGGGGVDPETIAPVEETTTATVSHPLGSIFYLNDVLYRALSDIAVGGTINTGTGGNATQTTVAQNFKRTVTLTSAEYAQLSAAEKSADIVYIITDDNTIPAEDVSYDPTTSGLTATNVQGVADELAEDKANQTQLAYVETGTTASRAYAVGEYFCWNGLLYRVTSAISSGGTFTPGTNCEATSIGTELTTSRYVELGHSTNTGSWQAVNLSAAISQFKFVYIAAIYVNGNTQIDRVCLVLPSEYFKTKSTAARYIGGYAVINANNDLLSWGCYYNSDSRASFYTSRADTQIYLYGCG